MKNYVRTKFARPKSGSPFYGQILREGFTAEICDRWLLRESRKSGLKIGASCGLRKSGLFIVKEAFGVVGCDSKRAAPNIVWAHNHDAGATGGRSTRSRICQRLGRSENAGFVADGIVVCLVIKRSIVAVAILSSATILKTVPE